MPSKSLMAETPLLCDDSTLPTTTVSSILLSASPRFLALSFGYQKPLSSSLLAFSSNKIVKFLFEKLQNSTNFNFCRVLLLKGGFSVFYNQFPQFCESSQQQQLKLKKFLPLNKNSNDQTVRKSAQNCYAERQVDCSFLPSCSLKKLLTAPVALKMPFLWLSTTSSDSINKQHRLGNNRGFKSCPVQPLLQNINTIEGLSASDFFILPKKNGPTKIFDFLFLGSMNDALDVDVLKENLITRVINISENCPKAKCINNDSAHFFRIPIKDSNDAKLLPFFDKSFKFIEEARKKRDRVLLHCQAGISRSATLAIAYVIRLQGVSFKVAYDFVKSYRPFIEPNFNFIDQLMNYAAHYAEENKLKTKIEKQKNIVSLTITLPTNNNLENDCAITTLLHLPTSLALPFLPMPSENRKRILGDQTRNLV